VPKYAVAPEAKLVPFNVIVNAGPPTAALVGLISVSVGVVAGLAVIVNGNVFDTVLSGLSTTMLSVPTNVRYVPATVAVNCVLETKVVGIAVPFHSTLLPFTNPVPLAVNVRDAILLKHVFGLSEARVGGVSVPTPVPVTVRFMVPDVVVSGFFTPMATVPAVAICVAATTKVS